MKKLVLGFILSCFSMSGFANDAALNDTLVRIINQLNATLPLLDEAQDQITKYSRVQLHIDHFEGPDGKTHPGVRQDILSIRNALIDFINKPALAPKTIQPLALDYIGR